MSEYCDCPWCEGMHDEPEPYVPQHPLPPPFFETRTVPFEDGIAVLPDGRRIAQPSPVTTHLSYPVAVSFQGPE